MTVNVDAIVQFRIRDPVASIKYVNNAANATRLLAQTTLRNTLGAHTLSEILSSKDTIQEQMRVSDHHNRVPGTLRAIELLFVVVVVVVVHLSI